MTAFWGKVSLNSFNFIPSPQTLPSYHSPKLSYCSWQIESNILYTLVVQILKAECSFPLSLICTLVVRRCREETCVEVRKGVDYNLAQA